MKKESQQKAPAASAGAFAPAIAGSEGGGNRITVAIAPGTDLNYPVPFQERNGTELENDKTFPQEVFDSLPEPHRQLCLRVDAGERDVLLVGILGVVSGTLPNVCGFYGGKKLEPNLFAYVLGPYGEGKSGLMWARRLAEGIHQEKLERTRDLAKDYRQELARYKKEARLFEQGKTDCLPEEPAPAPHLKHYIPANIAKTGMLQLIEENGGRGTVFETEADTLADALKQDHGGFSDTLRQSFGHEPLSYFRRTNSEDVEIPSPALSVVLSSTFDQLVKLIPSAENGLFSRFLYYELKPTAAFHNVFDKGKNGYGRYFTEMGARYKVLHDRLAALTDPVLFELQPQQEEKFVAFFAERKSEVWEYVTPALGGTVNRLGMICFRIAMQLSALRAFEKNYLPLVITCTDQDFENALRIARTLMKHTMAVYDRLPKAKPLATESAGDKDALRLEQKLRCHELFNSGVTNYRQIAAAVFGSENQTSKVYRWLKN